MSRPSDLELKNVTVGDLQSNPRGGKTAPLLVDGKPIRLKLRGCTTPFSCSAYDNQSTRRALDVRTDAALKDFCTRLDIVLLPLAKQLSCNAAGYKSLLKAQKMVLSGYWSSRWSTTTQLQSAHCSSGGGRFF